MNSCATKLLLSLGVLFAGFFGFGVVEVALTGIDLRVRSNMEVFLGLIGLDLAFVVAGLIVVWRQSVPGLKSNAPKPGEDEAPSTNAWPPRPRR